jgi:hypothetical protein
MRRYGLHDDEWDRIKDLLPGSLSAITSSVTASFSFASMSTL